jgi:hypothetical protein
MVNSSVKGALRGACPPPSGVPAEDMRRVGTPPNLRSRPGRLGHAGHGEDTSSDLRSRWERGAARIDRGLGVTRAARRAMGEHREPWTSG